MRLIHLSFGEIDIVGRDQWQVVGIGQFDRLCLGRVNTTVALQFNIQPGAKSGLEARQQRLGLGHLPPVNQPSQGSIRSTG